ncbi:MAG: methyltransferase domain-containing protein [Candidatus Hydrogenedentota bacterium]
MKIPGWLHLPAGPASLDLDSPEGVQARARMIRDKGLLKKFYENCYLQLRDASTDFPAGPRIEIGSGGGFIREVIPGVIETDVMESSHPQVVASGMKIPFRSQSLAGLYSLNVIHHIPDPDAFFRELVRTVKPGGGIVLVEPANTPMSSFIFRNFHHEDFDTSKDWTLPPGGGPMSNANQAIPWIIFFRDRALFEKKHPELKIRFVRHHSSLGYILSGGVSMRQFLPTSFSGAIRTTESLMGGLHKLFGLFMTIKLKRV